MVLDKASLESLTGRKHRDAQRRVLVALGIEHKVRPDGSLAVSAAHAEQVLGGASGRKIAKPYEPNWGALAAKTQQRKSAAT